MLDEMLNELRLRTLNAVKKSKMLLQMQLVVVDMVKKNNSPIPYNIITIWSFIALKVSELKKPQFGYKTISAYLGEWVEEAEQKWGVTYK